MITLRVLRWIGIAALITAYPLLAHYTNKSPSHSYLGALVAIAPALLITLVLAWRSPRRTSLLSLWVVACGGLWWSWTTLEQHFGLVYWLQHISMQLILFMTFARTLFGGRKPLCTRFAETVHVDPLSPTHVIYARQVTVAWSLFFAAMAIVSSVLFFLAPLTTWSVFANFLTLPLVALMFIAEYWVRKWVLPELRNAHILDAVRAFRNGSARPR